MIDLWWILPCLGAFASGLAIGITLTDWKWEVNWMTSGTISHGGSLFKVVRLDRWNESLHNLAQHDPANVDTTGETT